MIDFKSYGKFLIDNGLVFEINRKVLHPLGLALIVDVDYKNKKKLIITGIMETDDSEGFLYDPETFNVGQDKYNMYLKKYGSERLKSRKDKLGFIEQESADVK
jgi:hypothetical protein